MHREGLYNLYILTGTLRGADCGGLDEQAMCYVWEGRGMQGVP